MAVYCHIRISSMETRAVHNRHNIADIDIIHLSSANMSSSSSLSPSSTNLGRYGGINTHEHLLNLHCTACPQSSWLYSVGDFQQSIMA